MKAVLNKILPYLEEINVYFYTNLNWSNFHCDEKLKYLQSENQLEKSLSLIFSLVQDTWKEKGNEYK